MGSSRKFSVHKDIHTYTEGQVYRGPYLHLNTFVKYLYITKQMQASFFASYQLLKISSIGFDDSLCPLCKYHLFHYINHSPHIGLSSLLVFCLESLPSTKAAALSSAPVRSWRKCLNSAGIPRSSHS